MCVCFTIWHRIPKKDVCVWVCNRHYILTHLSILGITHSPTCLACVIRMIHSGRLMRHLWHACVIGSTYSHIHLTYYIQTCVCVWNRYYILTHLSVTAIVYSPICLACVIRMIYFREDEYVIPISVCNRYYIHSCRWQALHTHTPVCHRHYILTHLFVISSTYSATHTHTWAVHTQRHTHTHGQYILSDTHTHTHITYSPCLC